MLRITETTDDRFIGREIELPEPGARVEIDDFVVAFTSVSKNGDRWVLASSNYIVLAEEV